MELSYLDTIINTEISQFNTTIPMIGSAFDAFIKGIEPGKALTLCDIPDFRAQRKPFSTYAGDAIYCSSVVCGGSSILKRHVKGLSTLASIVNGFSLTLPEGFSELSENVLEELNYYVLPNKKTVNNSNMLKIGVVTASPSFLISINDDTSVEINRKASPTAICVNNSKAFATGYIDTMFNRFRAEAKSVMLDYNISASDIAAYRLGLFYANLSLPKLKKLKTKPGNYNTNVYLFTAHKNPDGTPNVAYIQYIFSLIVTNSAKTVVLPIQGEKYDDLGATLGPSFVFSPSCDITQPIKSDSFIIVTPQKLPLTLIGSLEK